MYVAFSDSCLSLTVILVRCNIQPVSAADHAVPQDCFLVHVNLGSGIHYWYYMYAFIYRCPITLLQTTQNAPVLSRTCFGAAMWRAFGDRTFGRDVFRSQSGLTESEPPPRRRSRRNEPLRRVDRSVHATNSVRTVYVRAVNDAVDSELGGQPPSVRDEYGWRRHPCKGPAL